MILQIQSDEPVVTLKESEYFKMKHIESTVSEQLLDNELFIAALIKEYAINKDMRLGENDSNFYEADFKIPGYRINITIRKRQPLKYQYMKEPER